jgi:hypothetical protein
MAEEAEKIRVSPAAARYVATAATKEDKLKVAQGQVPLVAEDLAVVLFFLCYDPDPEVKATAVNCLREMPEGVLLGVVDNPDLHPRILDVLAQLHFLKPAVAEKIAWHVKAGAKTIDYLAAKGIQAAVDRLALPDLDASEPDLSLEQPADETLETEEEPVEEESAEFKSKYNLAQSMGVSEKIKTALTGDKEWRNIFIRDANKLVSGAVVKNPRITDAEVLNISKSAVQNDEIMRVICANKEWVKKYPIRKALAENNKTPLPNALRFLATLTEKDLASIGKSKNVSSVLANQARRLLSSKKH